MKTITLFGTSDCHKTNYYKAYFESKNINYAFKDVLKQVHFARELRNLYSNRNLHFPTILINDKRLRNPNEKELLKWLNN